MRPATTEIALRGTLRGVSTLALLVALSALAAMATSKFLWGFFCVPPSIRFADHSAPERLAWFENAGVPGKDTKWSDVELQQNTYVKAGLEGCSSDIHAFSDCTFARMLVVNGAPREWLSAKALAPSGRESQLNMALQCLRSMGVADDAPYFGILGEARSNSGVHWAFVSAETTNKDAMRIAGERRHVECAWPENEGGGSFVWRTYRYDVAGVEFLTPVFMAFCFGFVALTLYGIARTKRSVVGSRVAEKG